MRNKKTAREPFARLAGGHWGIPAMTDFRAEGTIMGPTGLTAVFGMGTGGTPPVWSPERRTAGGQATPAATIAVGWSRSHRTASAGGAWGAIPPPDAGGSCRRSRGTDHLDF